MQVFEQLRWGDNLCFGLLLIHVCVRIPVRWVARSRLWKLWNVKPRPVRRYLPGLAPPTVLSRNDHQRTFHPQNWERSQFQPDYTEILFQSQQAILINHLKKSHYSPTGVRMSQIAKDLWIKWFDIT
jgi:hypothetical protein